MQIERLLAGKIRKGSLLLSFPDGRQRQFGDGEPQAEWRFHDPKALAKIAADPEFMLGQTYMDGAWDAGEQGLLPLLKVLMQNFPAAGDAKARAWWQLLLKPIQQWNRLAASRRNVARHYDLDESLFRHFLDRDMQYSCAYFRSAAMELEAAQQAKCEHIRRKLLLSHDMKVLDIGCGWGGLAIFLAREAGVRVTGLTLSREQYRVASERVQRAGLEGQVEIRLEDYREHSGRYDRIVSVGMFEHVGAPYFRTYFDHVYGLMRSDGVALIHTIGRTSPPTTTNPWIRRYIFPGGYIPAMSEAMEAVEKSGLITADIEVLRLHYARTLAAWQQRFQLVRDRIAMEKGERFCRMWEFYLASSEASFRWRDLVVFQLQLSNALTAVPTTRDYLYRPLRGDADGGSVVSTMRVV
ncbi:SAM-dependent methyltransferase [Alkalilimnicola ehrlichii]|uniref:SAM-dependent methyltransferase n=1 Tax=Alkalilimnicola ehrlichii TaxID=351052 RepID=A0A3E0X381_9GAMM|nr:cyclopropane-fatty-acyl-phospholipid synthase family protein [Alkalilimnicola ehrlichii]RFA31448.1 SAM-dependent methyltransferase [Alkalilimnicola ehrlichii]RFA39282.1 SAM-dependent methyltransferase [Alkalilimnicola ehrlichii]